MRAALPAVWRGHRRQPAITLGFPAQSRLIAERSRRWFSSLVAAAFVVIGLSVLLGVHGRAPPRRGPSRNGPS